MLMAPSPIIPLLATRCLAPIMIRNLLLLQVTPVSGILLFTARSKYFYKGFTISSPAFSVQGARMHEKGNQMKLGITTITLSTLLLLQVAKADDKHIQNGSLLGQLPTSSERIVSTVPTNGDGNPYGVAFVPDFIAPGGLLEPGDVLVSNFNGSGGIQGTGTTIVRISKTGQPSTFFQGNPGLGLTTALGVLSRGFVLVGNVPTTDGSAGTMQPTA